MIFEGLSRKILFIPAVAFLLAGGLGACAKKTAKPKPAAQPVTQVETPAVAEQKAAPEAAVAVAAQSIVKRNPVKAEKWMIAAANPHAAEAGRQILRGGGSAIDAAIAAQMVLNLVEPQSSGIGGGAFLMHLKAESGDISTYDGREKAPAKARPDMFLDKVGQPRKFFDAVVGGLSVGVPGLLRMLEDAHKEHGKLAWSKLFQPAIDLAEKGFRITPRLNGLVTKDKYLKVFPTTEAYFHDETGAPLGVGHTLTNQPLADNLRLIAEKGADAFYTGTLAQKIVDAVNNARQNPGSLSMADMAAYKAIKRDPVCLFYRQWLVCGMGPPSSGGLTTLQILGILQSYELAQMKPDENGVMDSTALHLIAEASKLAFADRNTYIADPDFVPIPAAGMLDPGYLELRAKEISSSRAIEKAFPGMPGLDSSWNFAPAGNEHGLSTTHLSIIDGDGNAVSMTSSIENAFGSRMMVGGFLLNNQLTDFSFVPESNEVQIVNNAEANKRPRSSMAPTLVIDGEGKVALAIGSPGGSRIIGYVAQAIIAALDWDMDIQSAVDLPHMTNRNGSTDLEKGTNLEALAPALKSFGHTVKIKPMTSGLHGIRIRDGKLYGGADHRREGVALGD
jgi:gamma-glutamyltranspeptidase / glutathione hydrolase